MEAPILQNYDCLVINSELYQIEFCECWGTQNSISVVSFQWKGESKFGISPWFNWCLRFSAALIWREHFQGWTSKFSHLSYTFCYGICITSGRCWCYNWLLIGWAPKNVGRILGIFHETCFSRYVHKLKERSWGTNTEESKNWPFCLTQNSNAFELFRDDHSCIDVILHPYFLI